MYTCAYIVLYACAVCGCVCACVCMCTCKFLHPAAYTYNVLHMRDVGICTVYTQSN